MNFSHKNLSIFKLLKLSIYTKKKTRCKCMKILEGFLTSGTVMFSSWAINPVT